jgi:selenocysteine-specific elongation factor
MKLGLSRGALASAWGRRLAPKLFHYVVERLIKKDEIVAEQEVLRLPGHKVSLAADQEGLRDRIMEIYEKGGLTPPNLKDVMASLSIEFKEAQPVYKLLQEQGRLVKVKEDMFFAASAVEELKSKIVDFFRSNEEMGPVEFKELTGLSRKFAIPLLEYLDKEKLTVRVGDKRRLRKGGG